ncbi:MAG: D-tyrosyl-tRNA(Tyr) deacylase [Deltaproteobacteria bacterium]|nr:D-tyrosyl-tRNA(Tyr) deacylase [Deltaproteobacteria bacterium]
MRAVVQRVHAARVEVEGEVVGAIERGLCAFVGAGKDDDERDLESMAEKIVNLRVFPDDDGKMSRSVLDLGGSILAVSQFTVFGDARRGRRPSFEGAMPPEPARATFARFLEVLRSKGAPVATGRFAADMRVVVDNDGPITILLDSKKLF